MEKELKIDEFLEKKKDYSPYLVHLTKNGIDEFDNPCVSADEVLDCILDENKLKALNHFCYFSEALNKLQSSEKQEKFRVVCFTETPIGQIDVLLNKVSGRNFQPEPYGLVFEKKYIRKVGGNPVFYVTKEIAKPLYHLIYEEQIEGKEQPSDNICRLLALVTICEEWNDWHWEREWRIVGDLEFKLSDIYCGLCPENDILYFENKYPQVKFISPYWGINKILDKLVRK